MLGSSQWWTAKMNPAPPSHPSRAARRPVGADLSSSIQGTRAT